MNNAIIDAIQAAPHDFRVIERVPLTKTSASLPYRVASADDELKMVIVDVETTGLDVNSCQVIELGMVEVRYSPSLGQVCSVERSCSMYRDPKCQIDPFITSLTGITNEMVAGKDIDPNVVADYLNGVELVVAHNAGFDRPFFEKMIGGYESLKWACTATEIPWSKLGLESRKLEYVLLKQGYFYEGHRADTDCLAVAWLLMQRQDAFSALLNAAEAKSTLIRAVGAPFAAKDALKERGYKWNDSHPLHGKHWSTEIDASLKDGEVAFLEKLYPRAIVDTVIEERDATSRFKQPAETHYS